MEKWKEFKDKVKLKRQNNRYVGKDIPQARKLTLKSNELIVQRMSGEVSGKAQKYSRAGPREFVPFPKDNQNDVTLENIKEACERYFTVEPNYMCDVLAGKRGPSCKTIDQVPDAKVIYVRFIQRPVAVSSTSSAFAVRTTRKRAGSDADSGHGDSVATSENLYGKHQKMNVSVSSQETYCPRSLSISEMIRLGKIADRSSATVVSMHSFDMEMFSGQRRQLFM